MGEHGALRGQNPPGLAYPSCGSETPGHGPSWQGAGSWQGQPFPGSTPQPRASPRQSTELQLAGAVGAARGTAKLPGGCFPPGSSSGPCLGPLPWPLPGVWGETEPGAAGRARLEGCEGRGGCPKTCQLVRALLCPWLCLHSAFLTQSPVCEGFVLLLPTCV